MAQRCTYCGKTKKQHYDKDGNYTACVDRAGLRRALTERKGLRKEETKCNESE